MAKPIPSALWIRAVKSNWKMNAATPMTEKKLPKNAVRSSSVVVDCSTSDPTVTERGITLHTAAVRRPPPNTLDQRLNSHSKLHEVIALVEATEHGADEALMLDTTDAVATCNATNFFIITGGEVWTSTGEYNLPGVTRRLVLEVARDAGIGAIEKPFFLDDVYGAEEAFVTGTFGGLTPVVAVDGRTIGSGKPGSVTAQLRALYEQRIDAEVAND